MISCVAQHLQGHKLLAETLPLTCSLSFPPAIFKESSCPLHLPAFILNHDIMSSSFHLIVSQVNSYPRILSTCHMRVEGKPTCSSCAGGGDRTISGDDEGASYRRVINGSVINITVRRLRKNFCITGFKKQLKTVDKQKQKLA